MVYVLARRLAAKWVADVGTLNLLNCRLQQLPVSAMCSGADDSPDRRSSVRTAPHAGADDPDVFGTGTGVAKFRESGTAWRALPSFAAGLSERPGRISGAELTNPPADRPLRSLDDQRRTRRNFNVSAKSHKTDMVRPASPIPEGNGRIGVVRAAHPPPSQTVSSTDRPDDAGVFGGNVPPVSGNRPAVSANDPDEEEPLIKNRRLYPTVLGYGRAMIKLIDERKLSDALGLLKRMTDVDRVAPDAWIHTILITGCGRSGYTAMAFRLYNRMKERNQRISHATYVGLFNACANSPWPEDGLTRARALYTEIVVKRGLVLNSRNYHAMIKAFGRCGDLPMALGLADQMTEKSVPITTETFNFLLSACATDQKSGFVYAIMVWRMMREKRVRPDIYSYNLLLRAVHDCSLGDPEVAQKLILQPQTLTDNASMTIHGNATLPHEVLSIHDKSRDDICQIGMPDSSMGSKFLQLSVKPQLPDLLSPSCMPHNVKALLKAKRPADRLFMLGGMSGILQRMSRDRVRPNCKTFTQLIESIPSTRDDEERLLAAARQAGISPDVDMFNVLIKKRNMRADSAGAQGVLDLIATEGLPVDIATFGTLSMSCSNMIEARNFLDSMVDAGFRPNIQILGCLVKNACYRQDFWFLLDTMKRIKAEEIRPDPKMLDVIEHCVAKTKRYMVEQEKKGKKFDSSTGRAKSFRAFLMMYKPWLKELQVQMPDHPWDAFKPQPDEEDVGIKLNAKITH